MRLTFKEPDGTWGIKGMNESNQDKKLYGVSKKLLDYEETGLSPEEVERLKDDMESRLKTGEWIPCSERLPEVIEKDMQDLYPHVLVYAEEEDEWNIYVGIYGMYNPTEWVDAHDPTKVIENVIAWQPLPEPYRGCNNNA